MERKKGKRAEAAWARNKYFCQACELSEREGVAADQGTYFPWSDSRRAQVGQGQCKGGSMLSNVLSHAVCLRMLHPVLKPF